MIETQKKSLAAICGQFGVLNLKTCLRKGSIKRRGSRAWERNSDENLITH